MAVKDGASQLYVNCGRPAAIRQGVGSSEV